jgi:hypothetical protein
VSGRVVALSSHTAVLTRTGKGPIGSNVRIDMIARPQRLLVSLLYGRCLARLGLGARAVALIAAAHACRVALIWLAQPGVALGRGETQEGFALLEVALPSRLDNQ